MQNKMYIQDTTIQQGRMCMPGGTKTIPMQSLPMHVQDHLFRGRCVVERNAGIIMTKLSSNLAACTLIPGARWRVLEGGFFTAVPVFGVISRKAKLISERGDVQKSGLTVQIDTLQRNPGIAVIVIGDEVYKSDEFSVETKTLIHINGWSVKL